MKHIDPRLAGAVVLMLALGACVTPPTVPTIPVLERLAHALGAELVIRFAPRTPAA